MKRFLCHFLAGYSYVLTFLGVLSPNAAKSALDEDFRLARATCGVIVSSGTVATPSEVPDCWTSFSPTAAWVSQHPGCLPLIHLDDCTPSAELLDCNAGDGTVEIGILWVYDGAEPIAVYRVLSTDGVVTVVLVDDL